MKNVTFESIEGLITELQVIKWLLVLLVVIALYFSFVFFAVLRKLSDETSLVGRQLVNRKRQNELELLLGKGNATAVKFAALDWIASQPGEPYAHWFLAKAHYQLSERIEAKRVSTHLLTISPDWQRVITPWLERIEDEISPKVVK